MATYYPSMVVNFKLRFDEALHVVSTPAPVNTEESSQNPVQPTETNQRGTTEPLVLRRGDENVSFVLGRVPKKASVELPGYRQAATFNLTIDFRDLPIDPRTIRAAAVEIHLGAVDAGSFAAGMRGRQPDGTRLSQLVTRDSAGNPNAKTLVLVGVVDEWEVTHNGEGSEVQIEGRDMRGILLDSPLSASLLDKVGGSTIDDIVRQLLNHHPLGAQFHVSVNAAEWPKGVVPTPTTPSITPRHRQGARGRRAHARQSPPGQQTEITYWDAIVRYCYLVGAIPYFSGTDLRIRPVRSIFDQQRAGFDPSVATPFHPDQPRQVGNGAPFSVRRMVYGRDTESLNFKRKFAGNAKPKTVRCVAIDTSKRAGGNGVLVEARYPPEETSQAVQGARTQTVAPGGQSSSEDLLNIPVHGISDPARLLEVARNIFEEIGRNEMSGSCATKNLASFGGGNTDPDLMSLRPGDGVEFLVDARGLSQRTPLVSALTDFERTPFEEMVRQVKKRIGDDNLARVIVATARGQIAEIQRYFRVSNVHYDWSDTGLSISFDFQNYFVQRFDLSKAPQAPQPLAQVQAVRGGTEVTFNEATNVPAPQRQGAVTTRTVPGGPRRGGS